MKTLIVLLLLATGFALAALWQSRHMGTLHAEQRRSWKVSDGELAETRSGPVPEGWAVVVVGAPSGAAPVEFADPEPTATPAEAPEEQTTAPPPLGDLELEVRAGQTLSGIAHAHYGTAPPELVQALAEYNGLENADSLRAGQTLLLPELERLTGERE